jgi:hypothetical protein
MHNTSLAIGCDVHGIQQHTTTLQKGERSTCACTLGRSQFGAIPVEQRALSRFVCACIELSGSKKRWTCIGFSVQFGTVNIRSATDENVRPNLSWLVSVLLFNALSASRISLAASGECVSCDVACATRPPPSRDCDRPGNNRVRADGRSTHARARRIESEPRQQPRPLPRRTATWPPLSTASVLIVACVIDI